MRATYSNIKLSGSIAGVEFATATCHLPGGTDVPVSDRMSKFKLFDHLAEMQKQYDIKEADIDTLLLLIKEDASQRAAENEIE